MGDTATTDNAVQIDYLNAYNLPLSRYMNTSTSATAR